MSDIPTQPTNQQWVFQIMGAVLAIVGGFFAVIFRLRLERKQEINHIKISLTDELDEICSIIRRMSDTYTATTPHVISNTYLNELSKSTESFNFHRQKFFLINNADLRKEIVTFYKKLSKNINESINTVGRLGESQTGNDHAQIVADFTTISTEAAAISKKITGYKYKALWIC